MLPNFQKLLLHPFGLIGLMIRLILIAGWHPAATTEWYVPFLECSASQLTLDPWAVWLQQGKSAAAFPYGYAMWLFFLPFVLLCKGLGLSLYYAYSLTLLVADVGLLMVLRQFMQGQQDHKLLAVYWLSPIVLFSSYGLGLNDLIPTFLLAMALYLTRQLQLLSAGIFCMAAISAKLSIVLALPFFLIYLIRNRAMRQCLPNYLKGIAIAFLLLGVPFLCSTAGTHMLFNNPELGKLYQLKLGLGENTEIYGVPLLYLVMLYTIWRVQRLNFELFHVGLGVTFLAVILLTPASPGWFIWALPLLVSYQVSNGAIAQLLTALFSIAYVLSYGLGISALFGWIEGIKPHVTSLLHTGMVSIGIILTLRIWRETVISNDYFRLSRKPFVIGIAGDSSSGKDTLASAIEGLFGRHSVTHLSGDNYHLWDRHKPMWQVMSHLNPLANDLERFTRDLSQLLDGKSIRSRHYDHQTGKMSRPQRLKSNDVIIASGLHALYTPLLRECYDLSIYLDMDESLRQYYKLQRDVIQRRYQATEVLAALEKRLPDATRYIKPQADQADLIFTLQPINPNALYPKMKPDHAQPLVKLSLYTRHSLNTQSLIRMLVGLCGLQVNTNVLRPETGLSLDIEGEVSETDMKNAAKQLFPRLLAFLDIQPQWQSGMLGLMQLITLAYMHEALNKRLIK